MKNKLLVINGPNLNMLGKREPEIYGNMNLDEIKKYTENFLLKLKIDAALDWYQSNLEGEIVEKIQCVNKNKYTGLIINPAAYSHTSVAILDALKLIDVLKVEVHLSMTLKRENFRHRKLTAQGSDMLIEGVGKQAYYLAALAIIEKYKG